MTHDQKPDTTEQLRHDIDSGATGEKADWPDPAAAPLGTDAEASGNTPKPDTVRSSAQSSGPTTRLGSSAGAALIYAAIAIGLLIAISAIVVTAGQG